MSIDDYPMNVYWGGTRTPPATPRHALDDSVVHNSGDEVINGKKIFFDDVVLDNSKAAKAIKGADISATNAKYTLTLSCQTSLSNGGYLRLYGKSHGNGGNFDLVASTGTGTSRRVLSGSPSGTLLWDGDALQTTSDQRLKTILAKVPDAVFDAWKNVSWGQFKMLDSVSKKGNKARSHIGLIAQQVIKAFEDQNLDALSYGIVCHEQKEDEENSSLSDLWMVRYTEALAMEAAYQRDRADKLEARIKALEEKFK